MTQKRWMTVTGWVLTLLPLVAFVPSIAFKLMAKPEVVEGWVKAGYPASTLLPIGITELVCVVLYLIPRTSVLGALLTVGYLGGAVSTHVRASQSFLAAVLVGVIVWAGLFLREPRVRELVPLKR